MVMQRCHAEEPATPAVGVFGGLEHPHLQDHREGFSQQQPPHHQQRPEAVAQQGNGAQGSPHGQGSGVAHEHAGGVAVVQQEPQPGAGQCSAVAGQGRITAVAAQHQLDAQTEKDQ